MYDFHGIAVFQSHFIVILARYDITVQLDGDAVCTIFLVGQVSEQVLAGRFDVFAVEGDREDELALRDDINAVELVEDGARCDLLEYEVEQIPHSAEDDLPENNNPAKQDAILGRS